MSSQVVAVGGVVLGTILTIGMVYLFGMRAKSRLVQGAVIALCRKVINPRQMRTAGTPGAYASVIEHRGRHSGRAYRTPVGAVATEDGFLISLPYGRSQWARNVLAGGSTTLVHEGKTYAVDSPEIIPLSTVETAFAPGDQRMHRIFGVTDVLRLRHARPLEVAAAA